MNRSLHKTTKSILTLYTSVILLALVFVLSGCGKRSGESELYVNLIGGSGKASIASPTKAVVTGEDTTVTITFSSPNYDYMIVDGKKYLPLNTEGNSTFEIPVKGTEGSISVIADTVAMSKPHEIEYIIEYSEKQFEEGTADTKKEGAPNLQKAENDATKKSIEEWKSNHKITGELELNYAKNIKVTFYDEIYSLVEINGTDFYILTDKTAKQETKDSSTDNNTKEMDSLEDVTFINVPLDKIYVVSSASFDFFSELDAIENVSFTSFKEDEIRDEKLDDMVKNQSIKYAGKYSAPDYEMLLSEGCNLAIENTMIFHSPQVLDKLNTLGVKTLVDYSSKEASPYGRMEWIKLYGILTGNREKAAAIFKEKEKELNGTLKATDKTVAYFYITENGGVVIRKNQDYIAKLIDIAGGKYIFDGKEEYDGSGTMTIQKEVFFDEVKDCDILIYNSTISGGIKDVNDLISKCEILSNTKAIKEGNIYCTYDNIYLFVMKLPQIAKEFNQAFIGDINEPGENTGKYLYRLSK